MRLISILVTSALLCTLPAFALHKYEPASGQILLGGGTEYGSYPALVSALSPATPIFVSYYSYIDSSDYSAGGGVENEFNSYIAQSPSYVLPLLAINMNNFSGVGGGVSGLDGGVAAGTYDAQIHAFAAMCKRIGRPMYVRIGPEFNGSWEGYSTATFANAWRRIVDISRADGVTNVAWVWDINPGGNSNYMDYYPGDSYVDWWGLNMLSKSYIGSSETNSFMSDAASHGMPVMICESGDGLNFYGDPWNDWVLPMFNWLESEPQVKAWAYVDLDWRPYGASMDQSLQDYPSVLSQFQTHLQANTARYISSKSQAQVLSAIGLGGGISGSYGGPGTAQAGVPVTLTGSGSSSYGPIQTYRFAFVNGPAVPTFSTPVSNSTSATFPVAGTYNLEFIATDNQGFSSTTNFSVTVSGPAQSGKVGAYQIYFKWPNSRAVSATVHATQPDGSVVTANCSSTPCTINLDKAQGNPVIDITYLDSGGATVVDTGQLLTPIQ